MSKNIPLKDANNQGLKRTYFWVKFLFNILIQNKLSGATTRRNKKNSKIIFKKSGEQNAISKKNLQGFW